MRAYEDEAPADAALPQFASRYERPVEARGRTPVDILTDALALLHQDVAEYAFAGLIGAIAAAFLALVLHTTGGVVGKALVAPAVFGVALVTYAHTCAAVRRAQDNLEPDAVRALFAVLARIHALAQPMTLPLALTGGSLLAALVAARWAPGSVLTLAVIIVFAYCGLAAFQRALYVPALFARNATIAGARAANIEMTKKAGLLLGTCFVIALAPAGAIALIALATGFGPLSTATASFVFAGCMPVAATMSGLVHDALAPSLETPARRHNDVPYPSEEEARAERFVRRMR